MKQPVHNPKKVYADRRGLLLDRVKEAFPSVKRGKIVLFANFAREEHQFLQDSTFYYFTGITESAVALVIEWDACADLYIPNTGGQRASWVENVIEHGEESARAQNVQSVQYLGDKIRGYELGPFFNEDDYKALIKSLADECAAGGTVFALNPTTDSGSFDQRFALQRLEGFLPALTDSVEDISSQVAQIRVKKDSSEVDLIYNAIDITVTAHEAAARALSADATESEVQASIDYVYAASNATAAFPSIVGSGVNSTVLHYTSNDQPIHEGDVVVVDIGARSHYYCADLTRTYPVSGKFSPRQKEIYQMVLDCQQYIADIAEPGMWLSNKDHPEKSLNHLAREFFKKINMDQYFMHGLGHYLGLDVHDVGSYAKPLEEGNIITIEPGLYIREEKIGVRIEDNYWIVEGGAVCLSESLPKSVEAVEKFVTDQL